MFYSLFVTFETIPIDSFLFFIPEMLCHHWPPMLPIHIPIDYMSPLSTTIRNIRSIAITFHPWLSSFISSAKTPYSSFLLLFQLIPITDSYNSHQLIITIISITTTDLLFMSSSFVPTVAASFHIPAFVFHHGKKRKEGYSWLPTPLALLDCRFIQLSCHLFNRIRISQQTKDNTDKTSLP